MDTKGKWIVNIKGAADSTSFEISVLRENNAFGQDSFGWFDADKKLITHNGGPCRWPLTQKIWDKQVALAQEVADEMNAEEAAAKPVVVTDGYKASHTAAYVSIDRNDAIAQIKAAFKARGMKFSVTGGRGTAWGWISIDLLPADYKKLSPDERTAKLGELNDAIGKSGHHSSISIPSSSQYYREYIDRASGIEPTVIGEPYWD
jgi:hypothetical protein